MEQKILQLIKLIGEEVVIFETFVELLNRQQEALVANDMELLATGHSRTRATCSDDITG